MPEATTISRPPEQVPGRLPRPPTMMETKLGMISEVPMVGCSPAARPPRPRRGPRDKCRDRGCAATRTLTPSTETVSRSKAPARMRSPSRVRFKNHEEAIYRRRDQHHHEHAITGQEEEVRAQRRRESGRNLIGQALRAPDEARPVLDHEGKAKGQQQAVERIAAIKTPDQHALDRNADQRERGTARPATRPRIRDRQTGCRRDSRRAPKTRRGRN